MNFGSECNARTVQLGTVEIDRNMLRLYRNFHTYLTETPHLHGTTQLLSNHLRNLL